MDIGGTPDTSASLNTLHALGPTIAAAGPVIEATNDLPPALVDALIEHDLFRLLLPRAYGGAELSPPDYLAVIEAAGSYEASTGWCLGQNNVCGIIAAHLQPETARAIFATQGDILAWGPGPGAARRVDGGYRLDGRFSFASGSRNATWLGAHVPVIEPDGSAGTTADGGKLIVTLLFPRTRVQVRDDWQVLGLRGTGSDSYNAVDLFVPDAFALPRLPNAKPRIDAPLYAFSPSMLYASSFASVALGIARATQADFIRDVRDTVPRGAGKSRGENAVVQATVGEAEARLRAARAFLFGTIERAWETVRHTGAIAADDPVTIRLATTWTIRTACDVVRSLYTAAGALAIFETNPFEKRFRDVHALGQQIQGHAAQFETVGQILLGRTPDRPMFTF